MISEEKIKELDKEIMVARTKLERITFEDKASWVFLVAGIFLICFGFITLSITYDSGLPLYLLFIIGFLATELLTVGYSLMHKCLRGAWL